MYKFNESDNSDAELSRIKKASIICITFMLLGNNLLKFQIFYYKNEIIFLINCLYIKEIIGGLISNSLAILSDAAHMVFSL